MKFRNLTSCAVVCLLATVFFVGKISAQTSNGTIVGTIADKSGAAVPKATVKVSSQQYGEVPRVVTTDSAGSYRFESLLPGTYSVTVTAEGFDQLVIRNVQVKGSFEVTASGVLEVSTLKNTITVEASAAQELQTESGALGAEVSNREISNLPFFSLNPIELVLTQPGVQDNTNQMGFSNGINFSVNGTRPRANNFLIDGQDNNDNSIGGQAFQTDNPQAVQEVVILTNAYNAEFGRGGGSVTNEISKTGSNDFHGEAWELNRNNSFAAIPAENAVVGVKRIPRDNENTFGFDFGGPIKHNKLFVFGTAEWDRDFSAAQGALLNIPTASGIATLQGLLPNPNVQLLLSSLVGLVAPSTGPNLFSVPLGTDPKTKVDRGSVQENTFERSGISEVGLTREWRVRLDWNATSTDALYASYRRSDSSLTPDFFTNNAALPPFDSQQGGPAQAFTGSWNHTFSPRALSEFRFSYSNINFTFSPTGATAVNPLFNTPAMSFNGKSGLPTIGFLTGFPQGRGHKSYQFQEALSYSVGRHTFKVGGDIDYLQVDDLTPFNSRGTISFFDGNPPSAGAPAYSDLANFIDNFTGAGGSIAINFGNQEVQPFVGIYAPYAQDTWHVKPNLTVNLGLRYEYWGTVGNILQFPSIDTAKFGVGVQGATLADIASAKQQGYKTAFAPRVGFAYTPHLWGRIFGQDKTVIRAGFGIFYDGIFTNIIDNNTANSPNATGFTATTSALVPGRGLANATGILAAAAPVPNPQTTIESIASNIMNPKTLQWNLDIQRELPGGLIFTAAYVGTRGEHLFVNTELNPGINQFDANGKLIRMNPNFGSVVIRDNGGDSIYHSGQLTLDRKFSHGLLLRGAYTYSKLIDDGSEVFTSTGNSTFPEVITNQASDRGLSAYDRRHRFVGTYVWELPYWHGGENLGRNIVSQITRGWAWSGTITAQTGNPETITVGADFNGDGHSGNDRPSVANLSVPINYAQCFSPAATCDSGVGFSFDGVHFTDFNSSFATGPGGTFTGTRNQFRYVVVPGVQGNLGRNTLIGPGQWFYNTGVARSFKIHENHQLQFRAEFFNAFNHPNFFTDIPGIAGPNGFNQIYTITGPNFMDTALTIAGARQIKFWLKYSF